MKEKDCCFIRQPKADHQGSEYILMTFGGLDHICSKKILQNDNHVVRKLNANRYQILHRIGLRKLNPEKPPGDNYQEAQWQIDDNIIIPQDYSITFAGEAKFGGQLCDISILYADRNARHFEESRTHEPDTVFDPLPVFMIPVLVTNTKLTLPLTHLQ